MKPSHKKVLNALRDGYAIERNKYSRKLDITRPRLSEQMECPDTGRSYVQYLGRDVLFTITQATFREMITLHLIEPAPDGYKWVACSQAH